MLKKNFICRYKKLGKSVTYTPGMRKLAQRYRVINNVIKKYVEPHHKSVKDFAQFLDEHPEALIYEPNEHDESNQETGEKNQPEEEQPALQYAFIETGKTQQIIFFDQKLLQQFI